MATSTPFIADGLWRCLCPISRTNALIRRARFPSHPRPVTRVSSRAITIHPEQISQNRYDRLIQSMGLSQDDLTPRKRTPYFTQEGQRLPDPQFPQNLELAYRELTEHANATNTGHVLKIVEYLVTKLGQKPNARIYSALIRAQANAKEGSAAWVRLYMEEMRREGIPLDASICHDILKVSPGNGDEKR
jgi:hypothetical protein